MSSSSSALTLGMQLDAALAQLDSLSSPQLYTIIVLVTVLIATLLLGNAQPLDADPAVLMKDVAVGSSATTMTTNATTTNHPEPRWYIFRLFNYAMLLAFGASVVEFCWHADLYAKDQSLLVRVLLAWCLCLIYFFGFFGVSIVHAECVPQQQQLQEEAAPTKG